MLLRRASLITRLFSSSPLVRSRCMRAATSSRSQFLASACIREPRDGQGVRDAMRGGLRVAQLGFCLVLHAASGLYARFRQVGSACCTQPQTACADCLQALAGCSATDSTHTLKTTHPTASLPCPHLSPSLSSTSFVRTFLLSQTRCAKP
jgi:hypothetical protein